MPGGCTKFQPKWLEEDDGSGFKIGQWCEPDIKSPFKAFCNLCQKSFNCDNNGLYQVINHSKGKSHKALSTSKFGKDQRHLVSVTKGTSQVLTSKSNVVCHPAVSEQVAFAEIRWALKLASSNYSFASCDGLQKLFKSMFPGTVSEQFQMSRTKASYLISDGLGPHFHVEIGKEICESNSGFTVQFDETTTYQMKKQLDILIRHWSESEGKVVVSFWKALTFGHAQGIKVASKLLESLEESNCQLPKCRLISLTSDGPNVNKTIWRCINESLVKSGHAGLLPFIPCNLHVGHNSFRIGLNEYGEEAEQLVLDIFYWFKLSPCRKEDYSDVQIELDLEVETFIRHTQTRWLTLLVSLKRCRNQWPALKEYFLKWLPKSNKKCIENERYKRICKKLTTEIEIQMLFLESVGELFNRFLLFFQMEGPVIHLLHEEMVHLITSLMLRFLKPEIVSSNSKKIMMVDVTCVDNQLNIKEMEIGESTKSAMESKHHILLHKMRKFYETTVQYLLTHLPLQSTLFKDLKCLHPLAREESKGVNAIRRIALSMPQIISEAEVAAVTDEWKLYSLEDIPKEYFVKEVYEDGKVIYFRIDYYWNLVFQRRFFNGSLKYPTLSKLVKSALCLSHGNSDVERSLSQNKLTVTADRICLGIETINGLRTVGDVVRKHGGDPSVVPITKSLLDARKYAYSMYRGRLEEEKRQKALTTKEKAEKEKAEKEMVSKKDAMIQIRQTICESDKEIIKVNEEQKFEMVATKNLLQEANERLAKAIKEKNFQLASIAQGLVEVASRKMDKADKLLQEVNLKQKKNNEKKRHIIDYFTVPKKSKNDKQ